MNESDMPPDAIEQHLRRTFALRAEDMAPGDGATGDQGVQLMLAQSADGALGRHRDHRPTRFLLVAAVVVIVGVALAAIGVVVANDDGDRDEAGGVARDGSGEADAVAVTFTTAVRDLVTALLDERQLATTRLLGLDGVVAPPMDDTQEARRRTNAAVAALESVTATDSTRSASRTALDHLDGLRALRGDIDADHEPPTLDNLESATEVFNRYADMIGGLLNAQVDATHAIDDPDLQTGVQVYLLGLHQQELTSQLLWTAVLNAIEPGNAALTELARLDGQVRQGQTDLLAQATGTRYETAATTVLDQIEASGLLDRIATAVDGSTNLVDLFAAVDLPAGQGWPAFLDHIEQLLTTAE